MSNSIAPGGSNHPWDLTYPKNQCLVHMYQNKLTWMSGMKYQSVNDTLINLSIISRTYVKPAYDNILEYIALSKTLIFILSIFAMKKRTTK